MMNSMTMFGPLGVLLLLGAIALGVALLVKTSRTPARTGLAVVAVIDGVALIAVLAMWSMDIGMMRNMNN